MKNRLTKDDFSKARQYCFRLFKIRLRSRWELTQRLKKKGFNSQLISQVLKYFQRLGFLDDRQFTHLWLSSRLKRPLGFRRLRFELRLKGIDEQLIEASVEKLKKNYDEYEIVRQLTRQRLKRITDSQPLKIKRKLYTYLLARGFSPEVVHEVVADYECL